MITTNKEKLALDDFHFVISPYQIETKDRRIGRPLFGGKNEIEVVAKLEYAFSMGAQVMEACGYAGISRDSFYRYCKNNPDFRNRIELLQTIPTFFARVAIFKAIESGNLKASMWYLERKRPEEFSKSGSVEWALKQKDDEISYLRELLAKNDIRF
jgi:hypothetical protein